MIVPPESVTEERTSLRTIEILCARLLSDNKDLADMPEAYASSKEAHPKLPAMLDAHAISEEALEALRAHEHERFLELRWETLDAQEEAHVTSLRDRFELVRA